MVFFYFSEDDTTLAAWTNPGLLQYSIAAFKLHTLPLPFPITLHKTHPNPVNRPKAAAFLTVDIIQVPQNPCMKHSLKMYFN